MFSLATLVYIQGAWRGYHDGWLWGGMKNELPYKRLRGRLGHAGSPRFLRFCSLRCIVLTCSILGSVYLKTTVNLQNYINQSCSMPKNSSHLQKYSNQCFSILGSVHVYLKSTVNLQKYSNQCCSIPANVYLKKYITLTYLTYGGDNLIQLLLFLNIHGQLTAFSQSILFF